MLKNQLIQSIMRGAARLYSLNLCHNTTIAARLDDESFLMTAPGADIYSLNEKDIETRSFDSGYDGKTPKICAAVFSGKPEAGAVIISSSPYLAGLSKLLITLPPILDDFAQIIGPTLRTAESVETLTRALKNRNGCMLKNEGGIVCGRTVEEASTALLVAEKTAKTYILSSFIGSPRPLPFWEAKLMNFIYEKKYSKANIIKSEQNEKKGD
ncbi:MAG: class II aldolase/adducin family protein [Clostridiales bacterium]|jgi:ribulose-5-phosphate 4-epimerase/fuculose-1-phosphate aldolase|nr:class II aldolase/adducin family protein [Clostridiales bacterium]